MNDKPLQLISAVVQKDYKSVVENTSLENWKEALAVILTYSKPSEFVQLCGKLLSLTSYIKNDLL